MDELRTEGVQGAFEEEDKPKAATSKEEPKILRNTTRTMRYACEVVGYGTMLACLPTILLGRTAVRGDLEALCSVFPTWLQPLHYMFPAAYFLFFCILFGIVVASFSDRINNKRFFYVMLMVGLLCLVAGAFIPSDIIGIPLVSVAFSISRYLWKMHVINKVIDKKTTAHATIFCGIALVLCAIGDYINLHLLLLVSLLMFMAVIDRTFESWTFVPKQAMIDRSFDLKRRIFAPVARLSSGVAFGSLFYLEGSYNALIMTGVVWIGATVLLVALDKAKYSLSKSMQRGCFLLGSVAILALMPALPDFGRALLASSLLLLSVADAFMNSVKHYIVEKDSTLSDVFFTSFRHAAESSALLMGYAASFAVLSLFEPPASPLAAISALPIILLTWTTLYTLGAFSKKRDKDALPVTVDFWHEKVNAVAKNYGLTPRQTEILDALSRGRNVKYITQRLYLSEGAVKKQSFQIYKKLDVHSQQDLITLVFETELGQTVRR